MSFEVVCCKVMEFGFDYIVDGDLDVWCSVFLQFVEYVEVISLVGMIIEGVYIDFCFVFEMLSCFKMVRCKVFNVMEFVQKKGINIIVLGGFILIIFENFNLFQYQMVWSIILDWQCFIIGNIYMVWVICCQVENNVLSFGIDFSKVKVVVVGVIGDIGFVVCCWLQVCIGVGEFLLVVCQQ